jgi:hypothetical protein
LRIPVEIAGGLGRGVDGEFQLGWRRKRFERGVDCFERSLRQRECLCGMTCIHRGTDLPEEGEDRSGIAAALDEKHGLSHHLPGFAIDTEHPVALQQHPSEACEQECRESETGEDEQAFHPTPLLPEWSGGTTGKRGS